MQSPCTRHWVRIWNPKMTKMVFLSLETLLCYFLMSNPYLGSLGTEIFIFLSTVLLESGVLGPNPSLYSIIPSHANLLLLLLLLITSVVSDSVQPHRRQPTRLPHPWDSPGKNTGVGCHFLLQCMKVKSESEVARSCPTLSDPMDCSLPGSSVHGIFQARVLDTSYKILSMW